MPSQPLAILLCLCLVTLARAESSVAGLLEQHRAHPSDWKLCNQIAIAYTEARQFSDAAAFYRKVLVLNPPFLPARKNLAVVLWFQDQKKEAEKIFRGLLQSNPKDPVPHLYAGLADYDRKLYAQAKTHFSAAGDLALRNPDVLPAVVDTWLSQRDTSVLPGALQMVHDSTGPDLATRVATIFNRHSQYRSTIAALSSRPFPGSEGYALLAEAFDKVDQPAQAYATLTRAISDAPEEERGYLTLAVFASDHRNNAYAVEVIAKGLQRKPRSPVLLLQQGLLHASEGNREAAEQSLRAASETDPRWILPILALGVIQMESGDSEGALVLFRRTVQAAPGDRYAWYFCALALARSANADRPEVIRNLLKSLEIAPDYAFARVLLGQTYVAEGRFTEGVRELERVLSFEPNNTTALYQLGLAYRKLGRIQLSQQRLASFRAFKDKTKEEQSAIVQIMKIVK